MQIHTQTDPQKGPGYALFTLTSDGPHEPFPADLTSAGLILQSSSTRAYWNGSKWVQGKTSFKPLSSELSGQSILVCLGPDIVDHFDPVENYLLCLVSGDGAEACGVFFVENVQTSLVQGSAAPEVPQSVKPEESIVAPPSVPEFPTAVVADEPVQGTEPVVEAPTPADQSAKSVAEPAKVQNAIKPTPPVTQKQSNKDVFIGLGVLALVCLASALYFGVIKKSPREPVDVSLESIQSLLAQNTPVPELRKLLDEAVWDEDNMDACFLLSEYLANKAADPGAMAIVASFYDPTARYPRGSIVPDPVQAYIWYKAALKAGLAGAEEDMDRLRLWLENEAASNPEAAAQLREIQNMPQ